jgi:hypothetical protein
VIESEEFDCEYCPWSIEDGSYEDGDDECVCICMETESHQRRARFLPGLNAGVSALCFR